MTDPPFRLKVSPFPPPPAWPVNVPPVKLKTSLPYWPSRYAVVLADTLYVSFAPLPIRFANPEKATEWPPAVYVGDPSSSHVDVTSRPSSVPPLPVSVSTSANVPPAVIEPSAPSASRTLSVTPLATVETSSWSLPAPASMVRPAGRPVRSATLITSSPARVSTITSPVKAFSGTVTVLVPSPVAPAILVPIALFGSLTTRSDPTTDSVSVSAELPPSTSVIVRLPPDNATSVSTSVTVIANASSYVPPLPSSVWTRML